MVDKSDPLVFLLDLSIDDGIKVIVDSVFKWADLLIVQEASDVPIYVVSYFANKHSTSNRINFAQWKPDQFRSSLIGEFNILIRHLQLNESRERFQYKSQVVDQTERLNRANAVANLAYKLSIVDALALFGDLIDRWITMCPLEILRTISADMRIVSPDEIWTDQRCMLLILKVLYDETAN